MQQTADNALTLERFTAGLRWPDYLATGPRNLDLFKANYQDLELSDDQARRLRSLADRPDGPHHIAVIGEDWCPDVYRGIGVAQRMAEALGNDLRILAREQNMDLMEPYLLKGEFAAIPVIIFYDRDHRKIAHFVERPALAYEELRTATIPTHPAYVKLDVIAKERGHELSDEEIKQIRVEAREKFVAWQFGPMWAGWRVATVDECIESLETALSGSAQGGAPMRAAGG